MSRTPEVTLVTREGCHLCEEVREVLTRVRGDLGFELVVRDMDASPELPPEWSEELPVVLVDGRKRFKFHVDEGRLRRLLRRARKERTWWGGRRGGGRGTGEGESR